MKILLFGTTNSGKDTVAKMFSESLASRNYGSAEILALADPMKRIVQRLFGCTEEQLWGPSATRNALSIPPEHPFTHHAGQIPLETQMAVSRWLENDVKLPNPDAAFRTFGGWLRDLGQHSGHAVGKNVGLSPRKVLQTLGTEWGRGIDPQMWIKVGERLTNQLLGGGYAYDKEQGLIEAPGHFPSAVIVTDGRFRNELVTMKQHGFKVVHVIDASSKAEQAGAAALTHGSEREQRTVPDFWFDYQIYNHKDGLSLLAPLVDSLVQDIITSSTVNLR